jgi:uncharacterized membrane protein HdeD (DUF308 family)
MRVALATNWWALVIRGVLGILLGVVTFAWPGITLTALVFLFGAYALIDGIMAIVGAVRAMERHDRWGVLVLEGIVGIAAAAVTVLWPAITALSLVFVIAAWALVTGFLELVAAVRLRKHVRHEWLLVLGGVASVAFGVLIAMAPLAGALVIALWFGAYAFVFGVVLVGLGFKLRSWQHHMQTGPAVTAPAH